ncbi:MAG: hypothetical protein ACREEZ_02415, partial [Stellaceae bacterium]
MPKRRMRWSFTTNVAAFGTLATGPWMTPGAAAGVAVSGDVGGGDVGGGGVLGGAALCVPAAAPPCPAAAAGAGDPASFSNS